MSCTLKNSFLASTIFLMLCWTATLFGQKIHGITLVAPPEPIGEKEMLEVQQINANWIALVPYGFTRIGATDIRYNLERQWWGERKEGIISSIADAKKVGLKILLKPQIYIHQSWVGYIDFDTESEWLAFENAYREFIEFYIDLAIEYEVEMICLGTELKLFSEKRPEFWKNLADSTRDKYKGQIVYSANWDSYDNVSFWKHFDYIGISGYFPLTDTATPTVNLLKAKWRKTKKRLKRYSIKHDRQILFTEYGYLTIDGCAGKSWELEKKVYDINLNEKAQANAYEALLSLFLKEDFFAGGFLWKWFPAGMGHEGYPEKDYTPQGKESEAVLKKIFAEY